MNLFVSRLNSGTTAKDLQKLFAHYGSVTNAKVIIDHLTGRSKCYGFVEIPNIYEAHEAIKELDNSTFQESNISVRESVLPDNRIPSVKPCHRNRYETAQYQCNDSFPKPIYGNTASPYHSEVENSRQRSYGYRGSGYGYYR